MPVAARLFAACAVVLTICFAVPLYGLARYALHSQLYSHILLIPFISAYLAWPKCRGFAAWPKSPRWPAWIFLAAGMALLGGWFLAWRSGWDTQPDDYLFATTLSYLLLVLAAAVYAFGSVVLRQLTFPIVFLIFMAPFPSVVLDGLEYFLQRASAHAAYFLLNLSGMPVIKDGVVLQLPGISMRVAAECSGIHSSLVLFITSLLAGHMLLRTGWARALIALCVLPLAIVRNGVRIFTLGELCVKVDPSWIDSWFHHSGGPIWFVLSLFPFFLLLWGLRALERRSRRSGPPGAAV